MPTLSDTVEAFIASREFDRATRSRLRFWVDQLGDSELADITPDAVDAALVRLAKRGRLKPTRGKPTTRRSHPRRAASTSPRGQGGFTSFDVVALFTARGLYVRRIRDHVHGVRCPWSREYSTPSPADAGDTEIFEGDGAWPGFFCQHSHCADRRIRDVIALWSDVDQFCARRFERGAPCLSSTITSARRSTTSPSGSMPGIVVRS